MSSDARTDAVADQYQEWAYPEPIQDLPGWLTTNWQWFDPSHSHRMLWPDREYQADAHILIAGCGTSQAAVFAYTNPGAAVVAIDVSQSSLDHHEMLKRRYGLSNLELHLLPIEDVQELQRDFDLVVSTGVLHHLADPQAGMNALAHCLRPDGVAAVMVYAHYGRIGVDIMQTVFQDLGVQRNADGVAMVRTALATLPPDHPVMSYLSFAPDLTFEAGLVDTFLHQRARDYTVADCLDLVGSAGLVFQDWFFKAPYEPMHDPANEFLTAVAKQPDTTRWSIMERLSTHNACHFFTARRADRPETCDRIDVTSSAALDYVPAFRYRCGLDGDEVFRPGWRMRLTDAQRAMAQHIDGRSTLRDITGRAISTNSAPVGDRIGPDECPSLMRMLWERDFVSLVAR